MRTAFRGMALLLVVAACRSSTPKESPATAHRVLPFLSDDATAAIAAATEKNLPIFVDTWAPW